MENIHMQQNKEAESRAEIIQAGQLTIGAKGYDRIRSPFQNQEEVGLYVESIRPYIVEAEDAKSAVCMDGREALCLASDAMPVIGVGGNSLSLSEQSTPPIRPKMAGGLYDMATMMALLAGWSGLPSDVQNYDQAHEIVGQFLADHDYKDAAHTSDHAFQSTKTTECGAWMKKRQSMAKGAEVSKESLRQHSVSPLDEAVAGLNDFNPRNLVSNKHYQIVRRQQQKLAESDFFGSYDPIASRNRMAKDNADGLEFLKSDPSHLTHGHREPLFVVNMRIGTTIDRDALNKRDGFAPFVDDRWMRQEIANKMSSNPEEAARLLLAGDVVTVDVSDELLAPGMPVAVIQSAA